MNGYDAKRMRREMKETAKEKLGKNIFGNTWMNALLMCLISSVMISAANVVPTIGTLLLVGPMTFALDYMFLKFSRTGRPMEVRDLFRAFNDRFTEYFMLGLVSNLFIFLWSLLFIIPGMIKSLDWALIYYIKADNPDYDRKKCMDESARLMDGHRMEFFILSLSFLGWIILGLLAFGIGAFFVVPYITLTQTEFYRNIIADNNPPSYDDEPDVSFFGRPFSSTGSAGASGQNAPYSGANEGFGANGSDSPKEAPEEKKKDESTENTFEYDK